MTIEKIKEQRYNPLHRFSDKMLGARHLIHLILIILIAVIQINFIILIQSKRITDYLPYFLIL
mgnify:CR=1 FL=1